jgi:hypothetical protein
MSDAGSSKQQQRQQMRAQPTGHASSSDRSRDEIRMALRAVTQLFWRKPRSKSSLYTLISVRVHT